MGNIRSKITILLVHLAVSAAKCTENQTELIIATNQTSLLEYNFSFSFGGNNSVEYYDISGSKTVCVNKEDDCLQMSVRIFGLEEGYAPAPKVSPESFSVIYGGEFFPLRGPYVTLAPEDSRSLVADLGACADTICGDQEVLFEIEGSSGLSIDWMVVDALTGESVLDCPSVIYDDYTGGPDYIGGPCDWSYSTSVLTTRVCLPKSNCYTLLIGDKENYRFANPKAIISARYNGSQIARFDYQQFLATDFGSETSCVLASCPEDDESKLEMWFYTEQGVFDAERYSSGVAPQTKPDISWSFASKHSNITMSGILKTPPVPEGLSYFHYRRECIKKVDCFEFTMETLYERKEGDEWYFEQVAHRIAIDEVIYSANYRAETFGWGYPSSYSHLLGECNNSTADCSVGESLVEVSVLSGPTAPWECNLEENCDLIERDLHAYFFDEKRSKNETDLVLPDGMDSDSFMMFSLRKQRLPSAQYRSLRCVLTQDACVGLAMKTDAFESDAIADLSVSVDNVLVEKGFTLGGPCNSGDCNQYYTTQTFGSCQNTSSSSAGTLSAGAIAGISIGCVALVAALVAGVHKKKDSPTMDETETAVVNDNSVGDPGNTSNVAETTDKTVNETNV